MSADSNVSIYLLEVYQIDRGTVVIVPPTQNATVPSGFNTLETSFQTLGYSNQWHDCAVVYSNTVMFRRPYMM